MSARRCGVGVWGRKRIYREGWRDKERKSCQSRKKGDRNSADRMVGRGERNKEK